MPTLPVDTPTTKVMGFLLPQPLHCHRALDLHSLHKRILYCSAVPQPTVLFSGGRKPLFQDIYRSVFIPVVNHMARRAFPFPDGKIFYERVFVSATVTRLAARIHRRHFNYSRAVPLRLVFKHREKLRPRNTCDGFCEPVVFYHTFYI